MLARPKGRADHALLLVDSGIAVCRFESMPLSLGAKTA